MANYLVQEDGSSRLILEDSSGDLLAEVQPVEVDVPFIASVSVVYAPQKVYTGQQTVVTTPGTFSWLCPLGITSIYVEVIAGAGGGGTFSGNGAGAGAGGGAYAARVAVPVTPGTLYTFVVGAGAAAAADDLHHNDGGNSTFTGDSGVQVIAAGGTGGLGVTSGTGGAAASSTGDVGHVHSGGAGGTGLAAGTTGGAGGGASGNRNATGASGTNAGGSSGASGGTGTDGGGSGGQGGDYNTGNAHVGVVPGGGGGGGGGLSGGAAGAGGSVTITAFTAPFISSVTVVYPPTLLGAVAVPFIASATSVYTPTLSHVANEVDVPFISSHTRVYGIFTLFDPNRTFSGPGNGGETFLVRLAANGVTETATLAANLTDSDTALELTGDGSLPSTMPFVVTIDSEVLYVVQLAAGSYRIRARGVSNTAAAAHTAGATVAWGDSYDLALRAGSDIAHSFTADINSTGSFTYPGWLICFDSSQAYLSGDRYPMHVTEMLGVFDAGAGSSGSNRCDAAQPNAVSTATGASDDCPAALTNPARISTDIAIGDVAVVRYTNPEASVLDLGPRSTALQSWFGLKRVDATDSDVTLTDPDGYVVDTIPSGPGPGPFTGSVNDEWGEPIPLLTGIAPDASDAVGTPIDTPNPVPWTTVTLPGADRYFTDGTHYNEKGWPMCCLAVRQGNRRIPHWRSWDWHDYSYVYAGFGTDDTFCQLLINRNGIVFDSVPSVDLPGPQDIDGPDAVWDDATYFVGASWYVAIFSAPYMVFGPSIGGTVTIGSGSSEPGFAPGVTFPGGGGGGAVITVPPTVEGGSGGDIVGPGLSLFQAAAV